MTGIGEFELISRLVESVEAARGQRSLPQGPQVRIASGDDAAVTVPAGATATSVDAMVEGVHFRRDDAPLSAIGRKALAVALSDLAAMGAAPGEAYVQLGVPEDLDETESVELATGLAGAAADHGVAILGGDVTRAPSVVIAITVVGHADSPDDLVPRSGARPGELLVITGELGGAAAGLVLLDHPELASGLPAGVAEGLRRRQLDPEPRLVAGRALAAAGATAMIDISDGLGGDARHLGEASGVRLVIELERVPVQEGVAAVAAVSGTDAYELATARGEDYELLATVSADRFAEGQRALADSGTALTAVGAVERGEGVTMREPDGSEREPSGFDQLRLRSGQRRAPGRRDPG